jgi:tetratricopeptide (TPR) repeat protein
MPPPDPQRTAAFSAGHSTALISDPAATTAGESAPDPAAPPPTSAGRYELREEIAHGGMGAVYRATDAAFTREVAVKVLLGKFGPDSDTAHRFADEARITGQLQHPGIPPVFDLGTLPDGRPFLAMKLIRGDTLDALLARRPDPSADRGRFVTAFERVCEAVAYAHAHGVVHRDLKPQNVMVGAFGEVQVMDWGLAKLLAEPDRPAADPDAGDEPAFGPSRDGDALQTQDGSVLGTPAYMPPEQAVGAIKEIDARSDVFGLGGILAMILTGEPPFVGENPRTTWVMATRGETAGCLARLEASAADPELVALAKRCLAPKREDRPADAGAVARAVAALRAAADERARRAEMDRAEAAVREAEGRKRRRVWAGLAAVLTAGLVTAVVLAVWADRARRDAEVQTRLADGVKDFLEADVFEIASPEAQQQDGGIPVDANVRLRDVLLRASKAVDGRFPDRPLVEAELRRTLGVTLREVGEPKLAAAHLERVRALLAAQLPPGHPDALWAANRLAVCYNDLARPADGLALCDEILPLSRRALGADHPITVRTMLVKSGSLSGLARHRDGQALLKEALALSERRFGRDDLLTLRIATNLAVNANDLGHAEEALALCRDALDRCRRKYGPDHPAALMLGQNEAVYLAALGRHAEGVRVGEEVLDRSRRVLGADHPFTLMVLTSLGNGYEHVDRRDDALRFRAEVLDLSRQKLGPDHPKTLQALNNLAISHAIGGRLQEALPLFQEALAIQRRTLGPDHRDTLQSMANVAECTDDLGQHEEAQALLRETLSLMRDKLGADHPDTLATTAVLAKSLAAAGRHADALRVRDETVELMRVRYGPDHPETLQTAAAAVGSLMELKRPDEALPRIDAILQLADQGAAAGRVPPPALRPQMLAARLQIFRDRKDADGCRETAGWYEKLDRQDPIGLYQTGRYRAVTARLLAGDEAAARAEADKAMEWLTKAVAAGFRDHRRLDDDHDLDDLRGRDDFQKLRAEVGADAEPPARER